MRCNKQLARPAPRHERAASLASVKIGLTPTHITHVASWSSSARAEHLRVTRGDSQAIVLGVDPLLPVPGVEGALGLGCPQLRVPLRPRRMVRRVRPSSRCQLVIAHHLLGSSAIVCIIIDC